MGELIAIWRCWIPVTICGRNFSDNRCPLMNEVRSIHIAKYINVSYIESTIVRKSDEESVKSDPLEGEGNL